jgi:N-methylhydantoinase A/oxoprolinase/acetone carboxylase beta subunit
MAKIVAVDIGGTFTDIVVYDEGTRIKKVSQVRMLKK